jgi:hypothetical protein
LDAVSGGWLTGLPGYSGPSEVRKATGYIKMGDIELK